MFVGDEVMASGNGTFSITQKAHCGRRRRETLAGRRERKEGIRMWCEKKKEKAIGGWRERGESFFFLLFFLGGIWGGLKWHAALCDTGKFTALFFEVGLRR